MTVLSQRWVGLIAGGLLLVLAGVAQAEQQTVKAIAPWLGSGQMFPVEPDKITFLGSFEGIMYIEDAKGTLDAALMVCPTTHQIEAGKGTTRAHGHCIMTAVGGDRVFAKWKCSGVPGTCKGKFTLTGGTGRFNGITGSSDFRIRTALAGLAADLDRGTAVSGAIGLAEWPKLTYRLRTKP